jgi:5-formyltetrahydrofolate cyclo-ligase
VTRRAPDSWAPRDDSLSTKFELRTELKRRRSQIPAGEWAALSRTIVGHVERYLATSIVSRVALYAPIEVRREVDVRPLDAWLRARGAAVAYPIMRGDVVGFGWVHSPSALSTVANFPQPDASCETLAPGELDLILVPALAATPAGFRLGYGSGFYDRALSLFCPPATSLCVVFESQMRTELPIAEHDVPCHVVITEAGLVRG